MVIHDLDSDDKLADQPGLVPGIGTMSQLNQQPGLSNAPNQIGQLGSQIGSGQSQLGQITNQTQIGGPQLGQSQLGGLGQLGKSPMRLTLFYILKFRIRSNNNAIITTAATNAEYKY